MAKKRSKSAPKKPSTAKRKTVIHRVNRHGANGSIAESVEVAPEKIPIGEAMRQAVEKLGETVIDDQLAPAHLRELSEQYEQVVRMQAAFDARSEEAKTAKKSLESATEMLLMKVKEFTHPAPLPLFDAAEREDDLDGMLDADEKAQRQVDAEA